MIGVVTAGATLMADALWQNLPGWLMVISFPTTSAAVATLQESMTTVQTPAPLNGCWRRSFLRRRSCADFQLGGVMAVATAAAGADPVTAAEGAAPLDPARPGDVLLLLLHHLSAGGRLSHRLHRQSLGVGPHP